MIVRASTIALLILATVACGAAQAQPTTLVTSTPNAVVVTGNDDPHRLEVRDSQYQVNPPPINPFALYATKPSYDFVKSVLIDATQGTMIDQAPKTKIKLGPYVAAGVAAVGLILLPDNLEDQRPEHYVLVTDRAPGAKFNFLPPCELIRDPVKGLVFNTVKCPIMLPLDFQEDYLAGTKLIVSSGNGADRIVVDTGCENCFSHRIVKSGGGDDNVWGSRFADQLSGGAGNDFINGREGDDLIFGYIEADRDLHTAIDYPRGQSAATLPPDNDRLFGAAGMDQIIGSYGNDLIAGGRGDDLRLLEFSQIGAPDSRFPTKRSVTLDGGAGDDTIIGGPGRDVMSGGPDRDTILGKESDYGQPDEVDFEFDCGPNYVRAVTKFEYTRRSPGDPVNRCGQELRNKRPWQELRDHAPGAPWPWHLELTP